MPRGVLYLLCFTAALGQVPPRDPFDVATQAYWEARNNGNFDAAATRREEARSLLTQRALDAAFPSRVQTLAQIYRGSGRSAQARAVVQEALMRAESLGASDPRRIQLLTLMADLWQQDGNLLKALSYREKALAALEIGPPSAPQDAPQRWFNPVAVNRAAFVSGNVAVFYRMNGDFGPGANKTYVYQQLAELYRQLGRPDEAAKVMAKIRSFAQDQPGALAALYEQQGDLEEARALYRKQAEQAAANPRADPWQVISPLQSAAFLYQREERWDDAAATLRQALDRLEASGRPEAREQSGGMRLNLANMLQQAGQKQAAEQIYQALLAETGSNRSGMRSQVATSYANFLSSTGRAGQAEDLLKSYLADHADLQPWEEANALISLSQAARSAGHTELADEYRRAATEKQRSAQTQQPEGRLIGPDLQDAQAAVSQGNLDEAVTLALRAMASAWQARDREQIAWHVPNIASGLASRKAPDKGERLYDQLLALLETWSVDNAAPLLRALQQRASFLIGQKDRWGQAPAAIDRYRERLVESEGAETGQLTQVMHLRIEFAQARDARAEAAQDADELLALEESLSGTTSAPYMRAAQTAANVYQATGNLERVLALKRQIVAIADLTLQANDPQRGYTRLDAANAFANARQFEEAERLANEAVAVGAQMRPPRTNLFAPQADDIRRRKAAAERVR